MKSSFQAILAAHGKEVRIETAEGEKAVRAFLQLLRRKERRSPEEQTNLGAADLRRWLYIGPADQPLQVDDRLISGERRYIVQTAEPVYVGTTQTHWWALLRPEGERLI